MLAINWRGLPLRTYETVVNLNGNATNHGASSSAPARSRELPDRPLGVPKVN